MIASFCSKCQTPLALLGQKQYCPRCTGKLLLETVLPPDDSKAPGSSPQRAGVRLGEYELGPELGRGAMGAVYRARQPRLKREVAIKVILASRFAGETAHKRFLIEAQLAAQLDHPNIVPIHEVGETEDGPFFVMKLVEGGTLESALTGTKPQDAEGPKSQIRDDSRAGFYDVRKAATLVAKVARAVHHAHQRGVLHRDLKPGNILLDAAGDPYVTDFGLARPLGGQSTMTIAGTALGTPAYMSPEQADGNFDVTVSTDIWSLGAILFHLLIGRPPFSGRTASDVLFQVRNEEAPRLRSLNGGVPAELESICLKCLEKQPVHRYGTALELAEDLERWLRGEPITARPASSIERVNKWVRRHPTSAALAVVSAVAPMLIIAVVLAYNSRLQQKSAALANTLLRQDWERMEGLFTQHKAAEGVALLARMLRDQPGNRAVAERLLAALARNDFVLAAGAPARTTADAGFSHVRFSNDGSQVIAEDEKGPRILDAMSLKQIDKNLSSELAGSTGSAAVPSTQNSHWSINLNLQTLTLSNAVTKQYLVEPLRHERGITDCAFDPNYRHLVTASVDRTVRVWTLHPADSAPRTLEHGVGLKSAQFNAVGDAALTLGNDRVIQIWDVATGKLRFEFKHGAKVFDANFSPDGTLIATGGDDSNARLWSAATGKELFPALLHNADNQTNLSRNVYDVRFSPDQRVIITSGGDGRSRLWDAKTHKPGNVDFVHPTPVHFATMNKAKTRLLTAAVRGAYLWNVLNGALIGTFATAEWVVAAEFSPDDRLVVIADRPVARIFSAKTGAPHRPPMLHEGVLLSAHFSPDSQRLVTSDETGVIRIWSTTSGAALVSFPRRRRAFAARHSAETV